MAGLQVFGKPCQAQVRGRVTACAESQPRIQLNTNRAGAGVSRLRQRDGRIVAMPTGHDPDARANLDAAELRPRQTSPTRVRPFPALTAIARQNTKTTTSQRR